MDNLLLKKGRLAIVLMIVLVALFPASAKAVVDGIYGETLGISTTFNLTVKGGTISMSDGTVSYLWGYADGNGPAQYPGPTLIINQGNNVTVNLTNQIPTISGNPPTSVSIVFPGHGVTATGGVPGLLTREASPGQTVTYTFTASQPGTYTYFSGTQPELQVEMGLFGAIVVVPATAPDCPALAPDPVAPSRGYAYCHPDAYFDREYLFLLSEVDPVVHRLVEQGKMSQVDMTSRHPTAWFINGRNMPDTMAMAHSSWLPNQPYDSMPMMHPGEMVLMRIVGGGGNLHPLHTHGQNHLVIARDARLLRSAGSATVDLAVSDYTTTSVPGQTADAIWGPWTGEKLGWDVYGHTGTEPGICVPGPVPPTTIDANGFDINTFEYCPDHGKPIPVKIPAQSLMQFGAMYGGTPYLGVQGDLPPAHVQQNPMGGFSYMWHSHNERELTSNNIFIPGGMATMALVLPYYDMDGNPIQIP